MAGSTPVVSQGNRPGKPDSRAPGFGQTARTGAVWRRARSLGCLVSSRARRVGRGLARGPGFSRADSLSRRIHALNGRSMRRVATGHSARVAVCWRLACCLASRRYAWLGCWPVPRYARLGSCWPVSRYARLGSALRPSDPVGDQQQASHRAGDDGTPRPTGMAGDQRDHQQPEGAEHEQQNNQEQHRHAAGAPISSIRHSVHQAQAFGHRPGRSADQLNRPRRGQNW